MLRTVEEHFVAWRFVGSYMQSWALVEMGVNRVIAASCELHDLVGYIIGSNTAVKDKVAIARTGVAMTSRSEDWRAKADHVLQQVTAASVDRNMIAHTGFDAVEHGDGVEFLRVLARGSLQFSDLHWSAAKFSEAIGHLQALRTHLIEIEEDIRSLPPELRMSAVIDNPPTTYVRIPPARLSVELPQPQDDRASDQPKRKSKSERRIEQREAEVRVLRTQVEELKAEIEKLRKG